MAYVDYLHCAVCDAKTIYDADINYDTANVSDALTLCDDCRSYKLKVVDENGNDFKAVYRLAFCLE